MKYARHFFLLFLAFLFYRANSQSIINASRLSGPVVLDGELEDEAWKAISPLPYKMQMPQFGTEPSEKAEVLLAYDEEYLYLGGKLCLSDPSYLRPTTFKRDASDGTTDYFGIIIDSYRDKENAVAFFTTPTGLRWDGVVWNDALREEDMSIDWNTFWDVATTHSDTGWFAEIRIPWSSLRFQDKDGEVVMGIISWWYIAAKNEVDIFPLIPLKWGSMSGWKPSRAQEFRFEGVRSSKPLYIAPYILGGLQQSFDLNEEETGYVKKREPSLEAGLDLKYGITSNLTLDLTVNTDFAQVEADDQQVNLTRFDLFFPEKRLFFQERASIFDFSFDGFNRLFYSRKVGINEDGDPVRIYGGARLVGRAGKFDLGFLNMQTAASEGLNPENFALLRLRRQAWNENTYLGGIFTNRMDFRGNYNTTWGMDGIIRPFGDEYLTARWAQSFENGKTNELFSLRPARAYLNWERRRYDGFNYKLSLSNAGEDYLPGMGFELRENYTSLEPRLAYGWLMGEGSKFLRVQAFLEGLWVENHGYEKTESALAAAGVQFETKKGWGGQSTLLMDHEYVADTFELSDEVAIPIGEEYDFFQASGFLYSPFTNLAGALVEYTVGQFYDGNLFSIGLSPRVKLSSHFELEGYYGYNYVRFPKRDQQLATHLARLKALYMLDTKFSIAAFLQYNSLDEVYAGNIRLRFNPQEGNDLYIVYNDLLNGNRKREVPHLPFTSARTVVVKYTYTFRL
ncbi:MAG: carbohydrate binding family 9 domain-containing protein [Lewinellaceae bacterium]|nr:carbohydrate binding family 9 domain-containing protein [Lewinellaceae bacterium]